MKKAGAFSLVLLGVIIGVVLGSFFNDFSFYMPFILAVLSGAVAAGCSTFLDFSFNEGNIFGGYYRFIETYLNPDNNKNPLSFLHKPLGGCLFCMNIWISLVCWYITALNFNVDFWIYVLPTSFFSHVFLTISAKYLQN